MKGWALLGAVLGAGAVVGIASYRKSRELTLRAAAFERALREDGDVFELYLTSKGEGAQRELQAYAEALAESTGNEHLRTAYQLGPTQIAQATRLMRRLS